MKKEIVIKEIDRLYSKLHKDRVVPEYLVYLMEGDVKLECYNEIGKEAKDLRVNELLVSEFVNSNGRVYPDQVIREITFEEIIK